MEDDATSTLGHSNGSMSIGRGPIWVSRDRKVTAVTKRKGGSKESSRGEGENVNGISLLRAQERRRRRRTRLPRRDEVARRVN